MIRTALAVTGTLAILTGAMIGLDMGTSDAPALAGYVGGILPVALGFTAALCLRYSAAR